MTQKKRRDTALAFFAAYDDPGIDKRLYFDVWADRTGLGVADKRRVWAEVRHLTHRYAARARAAARRAAAPVRSQPSVAVCDRPGGVPTAEL